MAFISRHKKFTRQFNHLPKKIKEKFEEKLRIFIINNYTLELNNHSLYGEWFNHRSIDITGDVRAVFKEEGDFIIFKAIGTHHQLYGK
ncbi:MAG: hypothetical protein A3A96_04070 [Candidatus Zambryskibacteria bacterium RIFCSPLOWO2_01_FULL_39_39]|uniref:Addiction module toxin RelE n=1 Tax=Candidatus Zambryskibacteria bacterium RIFCSPLOWO2_01_FULL_39_39 TaxID=1802758 RepID=A0A1G2TZ61_9BACT|nr:MAG: hypothetical protein UT00_C0006G0070 [Parcubacteria group bacterium GW2011_GWA1_38_7]OHA87123.1 MAG: hypothetical protein A2644_03655 [Candidatus Zambryskibacteria bacterium RIFCSPHIGHO2_01_FULL_39_63]OHA94664.1 MAG: hypothetical protein A3B88_00460 [Candidatus Zambryskibacteria bacterium RIFCSPHIGHO2_02_FULL_39_19]OHA98115.1 MAG: hypothetical protein A3F20_01360 [Candidatus Zambryskibacteria bacterium RIFCSPHIGHO2_12_FULL_39_21]OHB02578.1 MAG: hypothetical protein A3A96_04070 [Candidat